MVRIGSHVASRSATIACAREFECLLDRGWYPSSLRCSRKAAGGGMDGESALRRSSTASIARGAMGSEATGLRYPILSRRSWTCQRRALDSRRSGGRELGVPPKPARNPRERLREGPTTHRVILGDSRRMPEIADESVHLVVTSPPYANLKQYEPGNLDQLGDIEDYDKFLDELDKVWAECARILVPGGRICCIVGDVNVARTNGG